MIVPSGGLSVLQVVPYYAPAWGFGGPPRVMAEEAYELVSRGHSVQVFTTDAFEPGRRFDGPVPSIENGVTIRRFRNVSNGLAYGKYRFLPMGLMAALRKVDCDVVHLSEVRHELAILTWRTARKRQLPLVVSAHGTLPVGDGAKAKVKALYDEVWVRPMISRSAALLAQTEHEAELYERAGASREKIHLLPLGTADPPAGEPVDLGVEPDRRVVLFLGRLHPLKGVDRLVRGFAAVSHRHPDAVLVVVGRDDGALEDLRLLVDELGLGDRVRFPGAIFGDDRFAAYRRADLFAITPTHFEETSLAAVEAASVGTPLLLGDEAEAPFLDAYGAGWRIRAGGDVAPVLDEALAGDLRSAGAGAKKMVEERHLWPVVGQLLESILLEATGSTVRPDPSLVDRAESRERH
jgi:glycosyltransferase involved in cell wall biosynthesis